MGEIKLWLYGDVTYDGTTNATDVLQIRRHIASLSSVMGSGSAQDIADREKAANVTAITGADTDINATDVLQLRRYIASLSSMLDAAP